MQWGREMTRRLDELAERAPVGSDSVTLLVLAITLVGLLLRLVLLGDRVAHFDEARVAYWTYYYADTGSFAYRSIIHGPFIQHVNARLFGILGANDFTMRLPVAVIGGCLPVSALLFREHLRRLEVVILSTILAVNPILLYYSRFLRSDLLVGTFAFVAFGLIVRFYDTRRTRYLYGIAGFLALAFAAKENAILYLLTWIGAMAILADQALARPREYGSGVDFLRATARDTRERFRNARDRPIRWLRGYPLHLVGSLLLFGLLTVFFYAPRGDGLPGLRYQSMPSESWVGFWEAVLHPTRVPAMLERTIDRTVSQYEYWFAQGGTPPHLSYAAADRLPGAGSYVDRLADYSDLRGAVGKATELFVAAYLITIGKFLETLGLTASFVSVFAVVGFLHERYAARTARTLVLVAALAGVASLLGYTLGTDIFAAWILVHVVIPLSIPAAVGLSRAIGWGWEAASDDDTVSLVIGVLLVLLVVGYGGATVATTVYLDEQSASNPLVQYAQPTGELHPAIESLDRIADEHASGADVLVYYGPTGGSYGDREALVHANLTTARQRSGLGYRPKCIKWFNTLPLPWYFQTTGASVDCLRSADTLTDRIGSNPPPMLITRPGDGTVPNATLREHYTVRTYALRAPTPDQDRSRPALRRPVTVWIHEDWTDPSA